MVRRLFSSPCPTPTRALRAEVLEDVTRARQDEVDFAAFMDMVTESVRALRVTE